MHPGRPSGIRPPAALESASFWTARCLTHSLRRRAITTPCQPWRRPGERSCRRPYDSRNTQDKWRRSGVHLVVRPASATQHRRPDSAWCPPGSAAWPAGSHTRTPSSIPSALTLVTAAAPCRPHIGPARQLLAQDLPANLGSAAPIPIHAPRRQRRTGRQQKLLRRPVQPPTTQRREPTSGQADCPNLPVVRYRSVRVVIRFAAGFPSTAAFWHLRLLHIGCRTLSSVMAMAMNSHVEPARPRFCESVRVRCHVSAPALAIAIDPFINFAINRNCNEMLMQRKQRQHLCFANVVPIVV